MTLPTKMRALVLDAKGESYEAGHGFELREVDTPTLNESRNPLDRHQVILQTLYAGVCGSDKGLWHRNAFADFITSALKVENKTWRIPGHEFLGKVVALGSGVSEKFHLKPGDIVSTESHLYCGECYQCKHGEQHVCQNSKIIGFSCDGCFAEYVKLPANVLWPTNTEKIRSEVAAIQEPLGNAVHVCTTVPLKDKTVFVSGCGTIGLFTIAIAKHLGAAKIIAADTQPKHLEYAKMLGAHQCLKLAPNKSAENYSSNRELVAAVHEITHGVGVDVAMEMAGFNDSVNNVIQATRRGGNVILFGIKSGDFVIKNYEQIILDGKTLHSIVGRRVFDTWKRMQSLLESDCDLQRKIYDVILAKGEGSIINIKDFSPKPFEQAIQDKIKILIKFDGGI